MAIREVDDPNLWARIQEQNLLRQYDLMVNSVEICGWKGIDYFDKYLLWALNAAAVSNICQLGGRFREQPIYVGSHIPPHFRDVGAHMDQFFSIIHENWNTFDDAFTIPAFALWRLNWIHPFIEGNGRTARAACYLLICLKAGRLLPGSKIVPERIRENRIPYYAALKAADQEWENGHFNVTVLRDYLADLVKAQLKEG